MASLCNYLQLKGVTDLYVCAQKGCPRKTALLSAKAHIQTGRLRINPILTRKSALKKKKKKKSASPDTRRYPDHLHVLYALFIFFII